LNSVSLSGFPVDFYDIMVDAVKKYDAGRVEVIFGPGKRATTARSIRPSEMERHTARRAPDGRIVNPSAGCQYAVARKHIHRH